jgi:adenosyl cobinamide kinase/adenosyl cobinamide phosphate guanylyltransferase
MYKIIIQKEEETEDVKDNPANPVIVERDRDERENRWELVNELVDAAKKRYIDGKETLDKTMIDTIQALADKYMLVRDEKMKSHRSEMEEDLERRKEEEREKPF